MASIYYLTSEDESQLATVAWLALSILALTASLFVTTLRFSERASLLKECYETLQELQERYQNDEVDETYVISEYKRIRGLSENHTESDFINAVCSTTLLATPQNDHSKLARSQQDSDVSDSSKRPPKYMWLLFWLDKLRKLIVVAALYSLPVLLFVCIEFAPFSRI